MHEIEHAISFSGRGHDFFLEAKASVLLELAERRLGTVEGARVLDVGCGLGLIHRHLGPLQDRLEGIDVSAAVVEEAAQRSPSGRFRAYDGVTAPYDDCAFDLTFAICVLHHVKPDGWAHFVGELVRVTRPGGLVAVFEHNPVNPLTRLVVARIAFDDEAVLVRRRRLEALFRSQATDRVASQYILFTPSRRLRPLERRLGRVPLGAQFVTYANRAADDVG